MKKLLPYRNYWKALIPYRLAILALLVAIPVQGAVFQRRPAATPDPQSALPGQPNVLNIHLENGRVTATIANCPVQKALQDLADRTGIIFEVRSQENPLISVNLYGVSLEEAIERIAPGFNSIFSYSNNPLDPEHITMVQVFPRIDKNPQPGIIYLGNGKVIKSNDDLETAEQALKILAEGKDTEQKERAIEILVNAKGEEAIKALVKAVSDPEPAIRVAAIEGLATLNAQATLPSILRGLKDRNPAVRQCAATATALLGTAQNLKDLRPLSADKDAGVAAAADTAIRKLSTSVKR
jgi:hypothetical protein